MKALLHENVVVDLVENQFDVSPSMTWMDAPDGCEVGWILENGSLVDFDKRTDAEKASDELDDLRKARDAKLAETDWWGVSDNTMTQAQTDYRQALRDITNTYSDLDTVVWPTKP